MKAMVARDAEFSAAGGEESRNPSLAKARRVGLKEEEEGEGTAGAVRGTPGRGRRRDVCRTRADGVRPAGSRPSPARDHFVRGLAVDAGLDCLLPVLAGAVFASAPLGAGWCA